MCVVGVLALCGAARAQQVAKHPITFADLERIERVSEPQISPDGKWVAYKVVLPDLDANRNASNIWLIATQGGAATQLTFSGHDSSPMW
jgi:Tol biopolymer transport system component